MEKIVVTGGSGFIGMNLIESLISQGYSVLNIDKKAPENTLQTVHWQEVDILNKELLHQTIKDFNPTIVIHLAAVTDLMGKTLEYYDANITGVKNLIEVVKSIKEVKKVIFTSSMYVCQPGFIPTDDNTYKPHTVYGESKVETEKIVKSIADANFQWAIIRPTSIWGPWFGTPYIDFFKVIYQNKYFSFDNSCTKTYGYVGNTVYQITKLMQSETFKHKVYYLGDLPATFISEWANEISIMMGKGSIRKIPLIVIKLAALAGDIFKIVGIKFPMNSFRLTNMTTDNVLPLDRIYEVAGNPMFTRMEGNKKTLEWLVKHRNYKLQNP